MPRSTRPELITREEKQAEIVAELVLLGADEVAKSVARCWHDRIFGDPAQHKYRCRSVSCLFCRNRASLSAWWRAYSRWSSERGARSHFAVPHEYCLTEMPATAKSLRNLRDRLSRERGWLFDDLGFAGLTDGCQIHVIASHPTLSRGQVRERLRMLWPGLILEDVPAAPVFEMSPKMLAQIGSLRRGLQPARFSISPRNL